MNGNQLQYQQWPAIYHHVKQHTYKSACSSVNNYHGKLLNLITSDPREPILLFKPVEHKHILRQLKLGCAKIIDNLNMIDLHHLSTSVKHIFDKLHDCLDLYHNNIGFCVNRINEQNIINHNRYVYQSKCSQCHENSQKSKIQSMMSIMTLTTNQPSQQQLRVINEQLQNLSTIYNSGQDLQLSNMIEQILKRKEIILGTKNIRVNNIYQQIMQYLQNIPQSTLNLSRDGAVGKITVSQFNIDNFSDGKCIIDAELQQNFGKMLRNPIKRLIKRILDYAKSIYCKQIIHQTVGTQTLLIKDQENIKMLLKNNENVKKQCQQLRKIKRQAEKQMFKMIDSEQKNKIKISQISTQNLFLHERLQKLNTQLISTKIKLQSTQTSKKQMNEKLVKDHTNQKAQFLRSIRQLELKIQVSDCQVMRLRKQTQYTMIHQSTETNNPEFNEIQTQTQDRVSFFDTDFRNSYGKQSKKNMVSKLANTNRKSDNDGQNNGQDIINQSHLFQSQTSQIVKTRNKSRHNSKFKVKINQSSKSIKNIIEIQDEHQKNIQNVLINQNSKDKANHLKRQSIDQKIKQINLKNTQQYQNDINQNSEIYKRASNKKYTQTSKKISRQKRFSGAKSQIDIHMQQFLQFKKMKQKEKQDFSKQSDYRRGSPSTSKIIRSKVKLQTSRMFISKPHCSPYIGQQPIFNSSGSAWLQMLEINNMKRQNQLLREGQSHEKMEFITKIMKKYSKLKQNGLLNKINQIVSSGQLQQGSQLKQILDNNQLAAQKQIKIVQIPKNNQQKSFRNKINITKVKNSQQNKSNKKLILNQITLTLNQYHVILVFGSIQQAFKYQVSVQIWGDLDKSIMVDNNFMSLCNSFQVFLIDIKKNNMNLYILIANFLVNPLSFTQRSQISNAEMEVGKTKKMNHLRHLSQNLPKRLNKYDVKLIKNDNNEQKQYQPHQLRNIFHKILRFHKIMHKKCNHIQQFLLLLGCQSSFKQ